MSKEWTSQQKLLHGMKVVGGATVGLMAVGFLAKWGHDRVETLFDEVNEDDMGIDRANSILGMANDLGPEYAEEILADAVSEKYENVTLLRKRA